MNIVIVLEMSLLEVICVRKRFLRKPATLGRQVQESSSSNTRSKTPGRRQIEWRRRTGSVMRLVNTMITAVILGSLLACWKNWSFARLPPEGCCIAQEAFTYAICLQRYYSNDIHTTANDVTKGLIGPC